MPKMRIAIPQYKGTVSGAYELSRKVSLHLLDFDEMTCVEEAEHDFPKVPDSFQWFVDQQVRAVLIGTIDPDNAELLADRGIHVLMGAGELSPQETAEYFLRAMAAAIQRRQSGGCCGGHEDGEEDGCCGGHGDDHECCGGKGHEDGSECCGGKGHEDGSECCGGKGHGEGGCGCEG